MKIVKIVRIISEHKQKKSHRQSEVIVKLEDGRMVTRHMILTEDQKQNNAPVEAA